MEILGKVWGQTSPIFCKNNVEIHRIEGRKGGYCSKHRHWAKFNMFFMEKGKLKITVVKDYGSGVLDDITIIGPGQHTIVPPGQYHQFEILEDCIAYEIYWVELDPSDIERETIGGTTQLSANLKP